MIFIQFRHDAAAIYYSPDEVAKAHACFSPDNTVIPAWNQLEPVAR